jgi:FkbM family methyltransferase
MSFSLFRVVGRLLKPVLSSTVYRKGRIATVLRGPSKGLRYRIFDGFGLAPIYGGWEPQLLKAFEAHVTPGSVVYDVGANYGMHTLLLARLAGATGQVIAFEPMPRIRACLEEHISMNSFSNVTIVPKAVTERSGQETFHLGHHDGAGHLSSGGRGGSATVGESLTVETTSLDDFVQAGGPPPGFIKIDIEGSEGSALRGAETLMAKHRPKLVVELHTPEQDAEVGRLLLKHNYKAFRVETGAEVKDMTKTHPHPDGMWGMILAIPQA